VTQSPRKVGVYVTVGLDPATRLNHMTTNPLDVTVELTKVLGDGRFRALLKQLRQELSSSSQCRNTALLAEVEERVAQLDEIMSCYDDGSSAENKGGDSALSPPSKTKRLLAGGGGAQQQHEVQSKWADLPAHLAKEILEHVGWSPKVSQVFRSVCRGWRNAHGETVPRLHLRRSVPLDMYLSMRFATLRTLTVTRTDDVNLVRSLGSLTALTSLSVEPELLPEVYDETGLPSQVSRFALDDFATLPHLTSLTTLKLRSCGLDDGRDPRALGRILEPLRTNLTSLDLGFCSGLCDNGLGVALSRLTALKELSVDDTCMARAGLRAVASLTTLSFLSLGGLYRNRRGWSEAQSSAEYIAALTASTCLTSLNVGISRGSEEVLRAISRQTALTHLDLHWWMYSGESVFRESLIHLTNLVSLDLGGSKVNGETLRALAAAPLAALEYLVLDCCPDLDEDGLRALASFPSLKALALRDNEDGPVPGYSTGLYSTPYGSRGMALSSLTSLTALYLDFMLLDSMDLHAMSRTLTALRTLSLQDVDPHNEHFCKGAPLEAVAAFTALTDLDLTKIPCITDEAVSALSTLVGLTSLDLGHCNLLTDEGIRSLSTLSALTFLNVAESELLTDEGIHAVFPGVPVRRWDVENRDHPNYHRFSR